MQDSGLLASIWTSCHGLGGQGAELGLHGHQASAAPGGGGAAGIRRIPAVA